MYGLYLIKQARIARSLECLFSYFVDNHRPDAPVTFHYSSKSLLSLWFFVQLPLSIIKPPRHATYDTTPTECQALIGETRKKHTLYFEISTMRRNFRPIFTPRINRILCHTARRGYAVNVIFCSPFKSPLAIKNGMERKKQTGKHVVLYPG